MPTTCSWSLIDRHRARNPQPAGTGCPPPRDRQMGSFAPQVGVPSAGEGECLAKGHPFALRCRAETEGTVHQSVGHLGAALGDFAVYRRTQPPELFGWALARCVPLPRYKKRGVDWQEDRKMLFTPLLPAREIGNAPLSNRKKGRPRGRSIDRLDAALGDPATVATACPSKLFDRVSACGCPLYQYKKGIEGQQSRTERCFPPLFCPQKGPGRSAAGPWSRQSRCCSTGGGA